jgi:hypothetical protein
VLPDMKTSTRVRSVVRDDGDDGTILPAQFYPQRAGVRLVPETRLMGAILSDAVQIYLNETAGRAHTRIAADVEEWLSAEDTASPFSFRNVCDALGIDHLAARDALHRRRPMSSPRYAALQATSSVRPVSRERRRAPTWSAIG